MSTNVKFNIKEYSKKNSERKRKFICVHARVVNQAGNGTITTTATHLSYIFFVLSFKNDEIDKNVIKRKKNIVRVYG